jgi:flagellin
LDNSVLNHNPFSISTQTTGGVIYFDNRAGYAKVGGYITAGPFAGPEITSAGQWYTNFAAGDPGSPNPSIWYNSAIDTSYTSSTGGMGLVADNGFNSSSAHLYGMISSSDYYDVSGNIKNLTAAAVDPITSSAVFSAIQINTANQASLGSTQNRLNYIVDNIESLSSNAASAQGRIVDTNYASEMAQFSRGQILQQASTSVLAAANMAPNVALNILNNDGLNNDSMTRLRGG